MLFFVHHAAMRVRHPPADDAIIAAMSALPLPDDISPPRC